ncbi:MAG: NAD(P)/FAD-dependent oxidoreductase [Alphaproteobacteria bacterium]|nr:NAD(P)/FAD-dependent oxidoreductase [Alphaproteobacteria bacterium]
MKAPYDVIVIGAGAAGMMCAIEAGKRGRRVWLVDHAEKIAEKIRISGGGRCNFTNIHASPETFLSANPHFCKSALKQYTPQDFMALVKKHGIAFHEKKLGQMFCDESAQQIIDMLLTECREAQVTLETQTSVTAVEKTTSGYTIKTTKEEQNCASLVIATGGLSIPKIGATKFGYDVARKFGLNVIKTRPGLVPLTFQSALLERCKALSGLSVDATVTCGKKSFSEGLLFTHRGLSGPSILQISSYWNEGEEIVINLSPGIDALAFFKERKQSQPKQDIQTALSHILPNRLAQSICADTEITGRLADLPERIISKLSDSVNRWSVKPGGSEGYRTAEVTLGGVDTAELSSKTMETNAHPGLYFIGEVVDVTGHLGGFNFQWAWSSGYVAGQYV